MITANGDSVLYFPSLSEGNYFVSVKHRNHLGVATESVEYLSTYNPAGIDFSSDSYNVFGQGEARVLMLYGKRALWVGDVNGDRRVIYQGPENDVFSIFSHVLSHSENVDYLANYISVGYHKEDLNMDGRAIYQGPNNDRNVLLYHTILAHPLNPSYLSNFIAAQKLP